MNGNGIRLALRFHQDSCGDLLATIRLTIEHSSFELNSAAPADVRDAAILAEPGWTPHGWPPAGLKPEVAAVGTGLKKLKRNFELFDGRRTGKAHFHGTPATHT